MKSLYDAAALDEINRRLHRLEPTSRAVWGKMTVAQMLAHCSLATENAAGELPMKRVLLGRALGWMFKSQMSNDTPMRRDSPTAAELIVGDTRDFVAERERLLAVVERFSKGGPARCTTEPHPFFGELTADSWGKGAYKHLDHHLTQFGV